MLQNFFGTECTRTSVVQGEVHYDPVFVVVSILAMLTDSCLLWTRLVRRRILWWGQLHEDQGLFGTSFVTWFRLVLLLMLGTVFLKAWSPFADNLFDFLNALIWEWEFAVHIIACCSLHCANGSFSCIDPAFRFYFGLYLLQCRAGCLDVKSCSCQRPAGVFCLFKHLVYLSLQLLLLGIFWLCWIWAGTLDLLLIMLLLWEVQGGVVAQF